MAADSHPFALSAPGTASSIKQAVTQARAGGKGYYYFSNVQGDRQHQKNRMLGYIRDLIGPEDDVRRLALEQFYLDDGDVPILAEIIRKSPRLETLHLRWNQFSAAGMDQLADTLKECRSLKDLDVSKNSPGTGKVLARFCGSEFNLRMLFAEDVLLSTEETVKLADALARNTSLLELKVDSVATEEGRQRFTQAVLLENRTLVNVRGPMGVLAAGIDIQSAENLARANPSLRHSTNGNGIDARNMMRLDTLRTRLDQQQADEVSPRDLRVAQRLAPAYFYSFFAHSAEDEEMVFSVPERAAFDAWVQTLPQMPEGKGRAFIEAFFTPDATGFAPADNPALINNAQEAVALLHDHEWGVRDLLRRSPKGSSLLDVLAMHYPMERIVGDLNLRGLHVGPRHLQDEQGRPTEFMEAISQKWESQKRLVSRPNLSGRPLGEQRQIHAMIFPERKQEYSFAGVMCPARNAQQMAWGR